MSTPATPRPELHGLDPARVRIAIAVSRYNAAIADALLEGARACLTAAGVPAHHVTVEHVPGAFELPLAARWLLTAGADAVLCLGAVIRGETAHFEHVARECAAGIRRVALELRAPVLFGVLTTDTVAQAEARCRPDATNKGWECAAAALAMIALGRRLAPRSTRPARPR